MNRAHQLTDAEDRQAGRWGCFGNPKAPHLSSMWLFSPRILTLCDLPCVSLPGGQVLPTHSCPSHHTPGAPGRDKLGDQRQWGVAACPKSSRRVESCTVLLLSSSKAWGCAEVGHDVSMCYMMSPKSALDPTAFIPSPRHLRPPLHVAVGSHGPRGRRTGSFSL